ncbi:DNA polymerase I [Zymomonas mobilis]|uniref:DNA polymerase I n=1 Tax=Zymomonas mobilis subsp. pomaceae (strain ATCC 29192 / DSM 22645 / JCM 10191 / CCUG 17912 / NBRC 13757 / NCIMB 11200 / NRRL B-4491 / Barker I) TaxID=579138 RepID=F8ESR6_ZYMMT|nr:DNA polymerase I [Zymomonas mobilis]AEI37841.1 DNA polymerase I [Zymomonas mobilis subsp. pomaceae ATCC 29192]MDX5949208.1 DNA polymerase I [Zymomonas mobilis subsp. pomaceae]GEB89564.1 DNA polymerase I [Zymomonas mobilis subsp. pomaceae]
MTDHSEKPHLILIDGSGYIFRAYHRLPPLTNKEGQPAGAVYGFTTMLWKLIENVRKQDGPTHFAVIFDSSRKNFRQAIYSEYKAHRPPPPEDLVPQFPLIREATRAFSVPCLEKEGLEADDIIAGYSKVALQRGFSVTVYSSDKDLMQLIQPGLSLFDPVNNRSIGSTEVIEKFGVEPEKLGDLLALTGDTSDNIPGVPGVGPKTASRLLNEYGSLTKVLAAAPEIKQPKLRQNMIAYADTALLSRQLVSLADDKTLPAPLDDLVIRGVNMAPLQAFLAEQGFQSLLARAGAGKTPPVAASVSEAATVQQNFDRSLYETVLDIETLDRWIAEAYKTGFVAVDTETDNLEATQANLVGISLATAPNKACYIPCGHGGFDLLDQAPKQIEVKALTDRIRPLLEDPSILKIGQNIKYDMIVLARHQVAITPYDDTMVMSYDLDAGKHGHGMDELSRLHFNHEPISFKSLCGSGKSALSFNQLPIEQAAPYAAEDADITLRLRQLFKPRLSTEQVTAIYEYVDRPLPPVIARMEQAGIAVDQSALARLSRRFATDISRLEQEIYDLAGTRFLISSPKQMGEILFGQLGLEGGKKSKTGQWSTNVTELERLSASGEKIAVKIMEWRQLTKLKSTYSDALIGKINPETGRVHTNFTLTGAQTGRLSSTDPNLQNIPIRTDIGREIREAFIATPDHVLLSADYSQIELRLAACVADEPALLQAFKDKEDIHALTAKQLFGHVDRESRARAKTINFAILYGISAWGLAARLEIDRTTAQAIIDRYFERFPAIRQYIDRTLNFVREHGYVVTPFGRKTHLPAIKGRKVTERQAAERQAVNAPIQGMSADIIKRAMARMEAALEEAGLSSVKMLLQVHDELVFEVPKADVEKAKPIIRRVMMDAALPTIQLPVALEVEIGTGSSWGTAH